MLRYNCWFSGWIFRGQDSLQCRRFCSIHRALWGRCRRIFHGLWRRQSSLRGIVQLWRLQLHGVQRRSLPVYDRHVVFPCFWFWLNNSRFSLIFSINLISFFKSCDVWCLIWILFFMFHKHRFSEVVMSIFALITDHYLHGLNCKQNCAVDLASTAGREKPFEDFLPSHFNYLQFSYYNSTIYSSSARSYSVPDFSVVIVN